MSFDRELLSSYPKAPGVYLMKGAKGKVLYVGKAKHLQKRLRQYFAKSPDSRVMIPFLTSKVASIDTIVTTSEKEALLLENTLIKKHQPKYNALLKDDKTFVSLMVNIDHKWPMIKLVRTKGKPKGKGKYFGPYTNGYAARQTLEIISKIFPLRQCSDAELKRRDRPCILYDIKKCVAPCVNKCSKEEYDTYVTDALSFLKGDDDSIVKDLKEKMKKASDDLEFEKAQHYLDAITKIEHVTKNAKSLVHLQKEDLDSIGLYRKAKSVLIAKLTFRSGRLTTSDHYYFSDIAEEDEDLLESFLLQHYLNEDNLPKSVLVPFSLPSGKDISELLYEKLNRKISIFSPTKGGKKKLIQLAKTNAKMLFTQERHDADLKESILEELKSKLKLSRLPIRIECFDTSNIAGDDPVASLIAFTDAEKDTKRYRSYKVKGEKTDDYHAMKEVLTRRYIKAKETNDLPDLIIVDGGKGQLNVASEVLKDLQIVSCDLVSLAKEDARHDKGLTRERVFIPGVKEPITFDKHSPILFFLQRVRDEAHRRAITFHKARRKKRIIKSALDSIDGIGPAKKRTLLSHFGSVAKIKEAKDEEILSLKGISKKDLAALRKGL
ncbi:MAG: UvrABC system protein C [Chlamydiia bacterium]|nr:UvrABC system protein C [Chlamydiia bacterium]